MIRKAFLDSDVILDVATARQSHVEMSKAVLALIENGFALGVMSANSVTNIYYILRKLGSGDLARSFIGSVLKYVSVASVDHDDIVRALESKFIDFEDGVQNYCASSNQCDLIITRNIDDYRWSELRVVEPREFVALYQNI